MRYRLWHIKIATANIDIIVEYRYFIVCIISSSYYNHKLVTTCYVEIYRADAHIIYILGVEAEGKLFEVQQSTRRDFVATLSL